MKRQNTVSQDGTDGDGYFACIGIPTIVTLGPSGTCSEAVVQRNVGSRLPQAQVLLSNTYEAGAQLVAQGQADMLVVAAAYRDLNNLVFGTPRQLKIVDCFLDKTPAIVIASQGEHDILESLAAMPAPAPLAFKHYPDATVLSVNSNAAAADAVVACEAKGCITTDIAAQQRGLYIRRSFGEEPMAWVVMRRRT